MTDYQHMSGRLNIICNSKKGMNMVTLNEDFNWDVFNYSRLKELGIKYSFGTVYGGNGYCSQPIKNKDVGRRKLRPYQIWTEMLRNCYGDKESVLKWNGVLGTMCEEWKDYIVFEQWYKENYYTLEGETVLFTRTCFDENNTHYSPELCIFAPARIIKALKMYGDNDKMTGKNGEILPKGVYYSTENDYYFSWTDYDGKQFNIGVGDNILDLQSLIKIIQKAELVRIAEEYGNKIPKRLYERMLNYEYNMGEIRYAE